VPDVKVALQVEGQLIPAGALVIVPLPETVTAKCTCLFWCGGGLLEVPPPQPETKSTAAKRASCKNRTERTVARAITAEAECFFVAAQSRRVAWATISNYALLSH
jgi:hypothetical protein